MKRIAWMALAFFVTSYATEKLHPVLPPATSFSLQGTVELDEDVYSGDLEFSAEYAFHLRWSVYLDGAFRFLSYSYEYSTEGYIHNYCNLHVNGFNETYAGIKWLPLPYLGLDASWRFPPGEGSQKERFHRLKVEPFSQTNVSDWITLGTALRYETFLEDRNYRPGDEIGFKASARFRLDWNDSLRTGWELTGTFLYQARIEESENTNLDKPYRKMDDKYRGMKIRLDALLFFRMETLGRSAGIGLNYEIHEGTLFGFETGHRVGIKMKVR